jgi:hypothetical protein
MYQRETTFSKHSLKVSTDPRGSIITRGHFSNFLFIQEIEETVYGEKSVEVAKTLKLLGTISLSQNDTKKA